MEKPTATIRWIRADRCIPNDSKTKLLTIGEIPSVRFVGFGWFNHLDETWYDHNNIAIDAVIAWSNLPKAFLEYP